MVDVTATVDKASVAALNASIERLQAETHRSADDAVTYAGLKVASSGRAAAKIGKKNRPIVDNPRYKQSKWARMRKRRGHALSAQDEATLADLNNLTPFLIVRHTQAADKPLLMPSYDKRDSRREVERRGLSKKTWGIMVGKLGSMKGGPSSAGSKDYRVSKYEERYGDTAGSVAVRIINKLSYQEKAYPGITQRAVESGNRALVGMLDRRIAAATKRMAS